MNYYSLFIFAFNFLSVFCLINQNQQPQDCIKVKNFFSKYKTNTGALLEIPECCVYKEHGPFISCENGSITNIKLRYSNYQGQKIDFSTFPVLQNLQSFYLDGQVLMNDTFPSVFLQFPKLESLDVYNNLIEGFPKPFTKCTQLTKLNISKNLNIKTIPDDIGKLKNLEILYLGMTGLTSLSPEVYNLSKIKDFDLDGNPNLSTEIRFKNKVDYCNLMDTNVICYNKGSCAQFIVQEDPRKLVPESGKVYNLCDASEQKSSSEGGGNKSTIIIICIIIVVLVILCIAFLLYRRNKKNKEDQDFMILSKPSEQREMREREQIQIKRRIEPVYNMEDIDENDNVLPKQISEIDIKTPVSPNQPEPFSNEAVPQSSNVESNTQAMPFNYNPSVKPSIKIPERTDSNDYVIPKNINEIPSPVQPTVDITSAPVASSLDCVSPVQPAVDVTNNTPVVSSLDYVSPVSPTVDFDEPLSSTLDINFDSHFEPNSDTSFGVSPITPVPSTNPVGSTEASNSTNAVGSTGASNSTNAVGSASTSNPINPVNSDPTRDQNEVNNDQVENNNSNIPMCLTSEPRFSTKQLEVQQSSVKEEDTSNLELPPYSGPATNTAMYQGNTVYSTNPTSLQYQNLNRSFNIGYGTDQNNLAYYSDTQDVATDNNNGQHTSIQSSPAPYNNFILPMTGINPLLLNNGYYNVLYPTTTSNINNNNNIINNFNNANYPMLMPYNMMPMGNMNGNLNNNLNYNNINFNNLNFNNDSMNSNGNNSTSNTTNNNQHQLYNNNNNNISSNNNNNNNENNN
ncbi:hypothetical protein PIROE2DRAFT_69445 [Piromyces sp. E2]|nr:hypothetical protein PIROE2DRAFT_69445 [Piromyces sp. E2]|eukprot:OUM62816.1 hypothetical protein PIROE2DRAFT_69445 [Piromyces sp. E2]